jgi:CRISPR system Cascade subunit CasC
MNTGKIVELHILQSFPPSNLNRDDLGQPKNAEFGGFLRARVSSQCFKRAIRYAGHNPNTGAQPLFVRYTGVPLSSRTRRIAGELARRLQRRGVEAEPASRAAELFAEAYAAKKPEGKKLKAGETSTLIFFSDVEFNWVADSFLKNWEAVLAAIVESDRWAASKAAAAQAKRKGKKNEGEEESESGKLNTFITQTAVTLIKQTEGRSSAPDIALFGRMLADKPDTNVDAACQVAHAISTHDIVGKTPADYYTAVDDLKQADRDPGAAFLDVAYYNSACFYRYARLDVGQLVVNLGAQDLQGDSLADLPARTVEAFLRASEAAIPSGKQNSHAQQCRPSFMLAVLRASESEGWSLVNAFQKPVKPAECDGDLVLASAKRLEKHFEHLINFYGDETIEAIAVALPDGTVEREQLNERLRAAVKNMNGWVRTICDPLRRGA